MTYNWTTAMKPLVGMLALAGTLAACSGSTSPSDSNSTLLGSESGPRVTLRFVNAGFDGTANVYVNSVLKTRAEAFDSGYTAYLQASSAPQTVVVKTSGGVVLASAQITFAVDTPYTVVYRTMYEHSTGLLVLPDTVKAFPLGAASFRLVQVAIGDVIGSVDVYRTTNPAALTPGLTDLTTDLTNLTDLTLVASNVAGETSSPYVSFPAGPTRIIVTLHQDPRYVLYDSGIRNVSAGEAWTTVLMPQFKDPPPTSVLRIGLWMKDRS